MGKLVVSALCHLPLEGKGPPYRLTPLATSPDGGSMREEQAPLLPWDGESKKGFPLVEGLFQKPVP